MESRKYIMSIKPIFGEQILEGVKGYELRRRGRVAPGSIVVLYESSPVKAVVGEFRVGRTFYASFEELARRIRRGELRGCGEEDIPYIKGSGRVLVMEVLDPLRYPRAVSLAELRRAIPGFRPPVSSARFDRHYQLVRSLAECL